MSEARVDERVIDPMAKYFAMEVAKGAREIPDSKFKSVKLIGSYARGEQKDNSDVDVLVIWDDKKRWSRDDIENAIYKQLSKNNVETEALHVVVVSKEEFEDPNPQDKYLAAMKREAITL